jgi:hypothetical protein
MKLKNYARLLINVVIIVSLCGFALSCGGGGDDAGSTPGKSATITLVITATTLPADNTSSCIITATVKDGSGEPVRHYTEVNFTTNLGRFRNGEKSYTVETQPPLDKDGLPDPTAAPTGKVEVQFIAGTTPGTATVVVTSNGVTQSVFVTLTGATGNMPVGEAFSLSATYLNISGWWKYSLEDTITASAADINGNAVKDGTVIQFKTYNTGGYVEPDSAGTGSGKASSTLYSAANPAPSEGFLMVTGEATGDTTTRVTSIAAVPYPDQHIMYAGTNGGGGYKSTDSGVTWETASRSSENPKRGQNLIEPYIKGHSGIAVDPDNHNTVYVGTGYLGKGNVYRSLDGGNNWNSNNVEQWNGIYDTTAAVLAVALDGDNSATNYPYAWIGTEGRGALYATDGVNFQPSGSYTSTPVAGAGNVGNGTMSDPLVSYASVSETWTNTFVQTAGTATNPVPGTGNTGDGTIPSVTTSATTQTEDWTVLYAASAGTVTPGTGNVGDGNVSSIVLTKPNAASETWTLTAVEGGGIVVGTVTSHPHKVSGTALGHGTVTGIEVTGTITSELFVLTATTNTTTALFEVERGGTVIGTATAGTEFSAGGVKFTITAGATAYDIGDEFKFYSGAVTGITVTEITETEVFTPTCNKGGAGKTATFDVVSDKRGSLGTATAGTEFSAAGVTLTISEAGAAAPSDYAIGDYFTFTATVSTGATFSVVSSVGGAYPNATVGTAYSQNGLAFLINEGGTPFADGDTFQFTTTVAWLVSGTVSGKQTAEAQTGTAYTSDNNEVGFTITEGTVAFVTGDKFTFSTIAGSGYWTVTGSVSGLQSNLAINGRGYYSDNGEVYFVITKGTVSFADGDTFTVTASAIGHGWTVWDIVRVPDTHGSTAVLYCGTATGVYKSTDGGRTWSSTTLFTGDFVVALALYPTATGGSSDTIYAGTLNAGVWVSADSGTTWTQYTSGMDGGKGTKIKDILVDPSAYRLYALAVEGSGASATGDAYVHTLSADGTMAAGGWSKVNTGLSGKALYALAADIPSGPTALFVGGEGINLYEATSGLDTGNPSWASSKTGLSNLLMARMPILFSGECFMTVSETSYGDGKRYYYEIYVEDVNGNPPIEDSSFTAKSYLGTAVVDTYYDVTYPDIYKTPHGDFIHGTFRDPSNGTTNDPYKVTVDYTSGTADRVTFEFTPKCASEAPGCSGSKQTLTK